MGWVLQLLEIAFAFVGEAKGQQVDKGKVFMIRLA